MRITLIFSVPLEEEQLVRRLRDLLRYLSLFLDLDDEDETDEALAWCQQYIARTVLGVTDFSLDAFICSLPIRTATYINVSLLNL